MKYFNRILTITAITASSFTYGQEVVPDTTSILMKDVVISAQYTPTSEKNAIYKVKVIPASTIENKAAVNLRELLQQELNIDLSQNSVFGSSIEMQGISKENIKVLIDGIPVIGRLNGIVDLSQINLNNIQRVEVIEGPVSVFYGTDAMGGIINLITKKQQLGIVDGNITLSYESINATNIHGNIGYQFGKNTIQLNGGTYNFNGFNTGETTRLQNWEKRSQFYGGLAYARRIKNINLQFKSNFTNDELNALGEPNENSPVVKDKDYFTERFNNTLSIQGKAFNNNFVKATLSYLDYARYHNTYALDTVNFNATPSLNDNKDDNIVQYNYQGFIGQIGSSDANKKVNYAIGTDINREKTSGERILDEAQFIDTYAAFGSLNYRPLDNLDLQPSVRYTTNSSYGSLVSPAFNAKFSFLDHHHIRFSYARGFRAPSLKELFLDFHISKGPFTFIISGNEDLQVENSNSYNLHYSYDISLKNNQQLAIEPSFFYNEISNLIALSEMVDFKRHYINIDQFKSIGSRLDFTYNLDNIFQFKTGVSYIGRYNKFVEGYDTEEYLYAPEVTTAIGYNLDKQNLRFDLFHKYSGERPGFILDEDTEEIVKTTRSDFNNMDFMISKKMLDKSLNILVGVKNIFDVTDIETINSVGEAHQRDLQLWGRSFIFKTTYTF